MIYNLYKYRGETPLECIQRFSRTNKEYLEWKKGHKEDEKWTYIGRLDPMADGVLLAATGKDIKRKEEFLNLDKDYDFVALFGFKTDTYDILGRVLQEPNLEKLNALDIDKVVRIYEGEREQKYPPYSSKMQQWNSSASSEQVEEEIPTKKINIYKIEFKELQTMSPKELFTKLLVDISKVKGDFRQNLSLVLWKKYITALPKDEKIFIGKFSAHVSSGTYIRSLVNEMGDTLGVGACALSITRTRVGDFNISESVR